MRSMLKTGCILLLAAAVCTYNLLGPPQPDTNNHDYCREDNEPGVPGCPCDEKDWDDWGAWSECSRTCGGGEHKRCRRERCRAGGRCCGTYCIQNGVCNAICYNEADFVSGGCVCPVGAKGFCCECASPQYCKTADEWYYCDGAYNGYCHECQNDAYYLIHATEQCGVCSIPRYCQTDGGEDVGRGDYWCHEHDANPNCVPSGSCCRTCENTTASNQAYYLDVGLTNQCTPKCNWLGHWCWPGVCDKGNQYLASTCICSEGFIPHIPTDEITKCSLVHPPDILTCRLGAESALGEAANSTFKDNSTSCDSTEDVHINFEPDFMFFEYSFSFDLPVDPPSGDDRHSYVDSYAFGVVHASDTVSHYDTAGTQLVLDVHSPSDYPVSGMCSVGDFTVDNPLSGLLITCRLNHHYGDLGFVGDGEKLCHLFDVTSSGYVDIQDMMFLDESPVRHYYDQIDTFREVCLLTDYTAPDHCVNVDSSCQKDVLNFGRRIRRDRELTVTFDGWFDPDPGSVVANASGIKIYEIEVRNVIHTPTELYADFTSIMTFESTGDAVNISLPDREEPAMFAIYLWVLDSTQEGPNFQISRRFVLTDNTSYVELNEDHPLFVSTASSASGLEWQTHLDYVKLYWAKHFYNTWHVHTNLLLPIRGEGNMSISGPFEQETGELPVSGTPNVAGIVNFQYGYDRVSVVGTETVPLKDVPDALTERMIVTDFQPQDGDLVEFKIKATDIMNNTLADNVTIMIDSSPPLLEDMYLMKDGYTQIFVHNITDLSEMEMTFKSYDPHSGLQSVAWSLGTEEGLSDIGSGHLPVLKFHNESCVGACYCPMIGRCEQYTYSIPLAGLIANDTHIGDHHRQYHFLFTVINEAHLVSVGEVMILIDTSPPETGHAFDSPPGSTDRDFQSDPMLHFHWDGFIDHESGISKYHLVISERCFSTEEMRYLHTDTDNSSQIIFFTEHTDTYITLQAETPGYYRISVIAFNGAMDPSQPACSSGITYDNTPPSLSSVRLIGSVHQPSVLCTNDSMYFINHDGVARKLSEAAECFSKCDGNDTFHNYRFPISHLKNGTENPALTYEESSDICIIYPTFRSPSAMFLWTDTFHLSWEIIEPDSQMHDYFVGVASDKDSTEHPDIKAYTSTHNTTQYVCVACGIGQGEEVYIGLKGVSKAVLTEILPVGPVVIDSTPPVYSGGLTVDMDTAHITLTWQLDSFIDPDYDDIFTEYEWALGLTDKSEVVQPWTQSVFPFDFMDSHDSFSITVPRHKVEIFDQGKGMDYIFSLKCFNRARLPIVVTSAQFKVYKRMTPSHGVVVHTHHSQPNGDEIGFQEDTSVLCARWFGFVHSSENVMYALAVGTAPKWGDVLPYVEIASSEFHCLYNVSLQTSNMYYITVKAVAGEDYSLVSSKGIYVAKEDDIIKDGSMNIGGFCPDLFQYVMYPNISENSSNLHINTEYPIKVNLSKESIPFVTIRLKFATMDITIKENTSVIYRTEELELDSWIIREDCVYLYYSFVQTDEDIELLLIHNGLGLTEVALHHCKIKSSIQVNRNVLTLQWSFGPPHMHWITRANVFVSNYGAAANESSEMWNVGDHTDVTLPVHLTQGDTYTLCVGPCFHTSCTARWLCQHVSMDEWPPRTGKMEAHLATVANGIRDTQLYQITASWEPFVNFGAEGMNKVLTYDWTVSQDEHGAGQTTQWTRLHYNETNELTLELDAMVYMHVYKYKTLYFTLRGVNLAGTSRLASTPLVLDDVYPASGVQVFDLAADYNLDSLKDFLHSSNLGNRTKVLHDDDIDFTSHTEGISGALLGADCGQYVWAIQTTTETSCTERGDVECVSVKQTTENVVRFTLQSFKEGVNYSLCVLGQGKCTAFKGCSNGFMVDLHPPVAGRVELGIDGKSVSTDVSTVFIKWAGFSDIEEEVTLAYGHGIHHYTVSLGSVPMASDIISPMWVGLSTQVYVTEIDLPVGRHFYATVEACDHVDLCTAVSSRPALVDITPPTVRSVTLSCLGGSPNVQGKLLISWSDTSDRESGIARVEVALGETPHSQEISPYTSTSGSQAVITTPALKDGLLYYGHVKVTNRAGLWTIKSSEPVLYDSSPPERGFVRHGLLDKNEFGWSQTDTSFAFHWDGFVDPHSGVFYYRVALGTQPYTEDVLHWTDVGQQTHVEHELRLEHGVQYYLTVECCNHVLLCTQAVSSPLLVDTSPPTPGIVSIGIHEDHQLYQYSSDSLVIRWIGFQDLQSDINYFEYCIETPENECDIIPVLNAHRSNHVTLHNLNLPLKTSLFVRLIVHNNIGLNTTSWSKEFLIDTSKPVVNTQTRVVTPSSLKPNTQFDRSYVSLRWSMLDAQSPMVGYYISIQSHHDGQAPVTDYAVGDISYVTIPLTIEQHLQDGNVYTVKVTGCNAASLCTTSVADNVLVDSSPPVIGGFIEPMIWRIEGKNTILGLSWTGFSDPHSEISHYYLAISSTYNGHDISEGLLTVSHDTDDTAQRTEITLSGVSLPIDHLIYLTVWAENGVGLLTTAAKVSVFVLPDHKGSSAKSGKLDIQNHSCDIEYCNYDCTCAVVDGYCTADGTKHSCQKNNGTDFIEAFNGINGQLASVTPSSVCLPGYWINKDSSVPITRYEWSVSTLGDEPGVGLFDRLNDRYLFDVETYKKAVYCTVNETLLQGSSYMYHVNAWHDFDQYSHFVSMGVMVDTTPPSVGLGRHVLDMNEDFTERGAFTSELQGIYSSWENVFSDTESGIAYYLVSVGTSERGNEIFGPADVGLATNLSLTDALLLPGYHYYTTVSAFNAVNMSAFAFSKGFVVDVEAPYEGVVFVGHRFHDKSFQSGNSLEVSWHGFADKHSYIMEYLYSVTEAGAFVNDTDFISVNLANQLSVSGEFLHGHSYQVHVKAVDAAQHESDVVTSHAVTIDNTPPIAKTCVTPAVIEQGTPSCQCNPIVPGHSQKSCMCTVNFNSTSHQGEMYQVGVIVNRDPSGINAKMELNGVAGWMAFTRENSSAFSYSSTFVSTGENHLTAVIYSDRALPGTVVVHLSQCTSMRSEDTGGLHIIQQVNKMKLLITIPIYEEESELDSIQIGIGTLDNGLQLLPYTNVGHEKSVSFGLELQHAMTVRAVILARNRVNLVTVVKSEEYVIDWTAPLITNINVNTFVKSGTLSVTADWIAVEMESVVTDCLWAIGYEPNTDGILSWQPTETVVSSTADNLKVLQGDVVFVTVSCCNPLSLCEEYVSLPSTAVLEPPQALDAYVDIHKQKTTVYDPTGDTQGSLVGLEYEYHGFGDDSGIWHYEYQISGPGVESNWMNTSLQDFVSLPWLSFENGKTYTVSVHAVNNKGLHSENREDSVLTLQEKPYLTGNKIKWSHFGNTLSFDWENVFFWRGQGGQVVYEIFIGSQEGASDLLMAQETMETSIVVVSDKMTSPATCFCFLTAVTPSGLYQTFTQTIYF